MGYGNQVYSVPFKNSGLNADENTDNIPPEALVWPSRNINLHRGGIGKRGGTSHVDAAAHTDTPKIVGLFDYYTEAGNQFVVRATGDGKVYKDDTTTIHTGFDTDKVTSFAVMNDSLYITNSTDVPEVWDGAGAATTTLANIPTDWGANGPAQLIVHGTGNAEQMWAFAVTGKPKYIYASKDNDGTTEANFSDAEVQAIYIETGDGYGIVGGFEFQDRLFAVGRSKTFLINDTNADRTKWFYEAAGWSGGAASHRLIVVTPNDVHMMMEDGEIYSVTAVQSYGDYKQASLTRPAFINNWIQDNVDLSDIDKFHAIYDPELRAVKWFIVRSGETNVSTALVYFIDKEPGRAWAIHENDSYASGYDAFCSALVRQATGGYKIYTGDYSGFVWKLEQAGRNDNSNGYSSIAQTAQLNFNDSRTTKRYDSARLSLKPVGSYALNVDVIYDGGIDAGSSTFSMGGGGGVLDSFELDVDLLGGGTLIEGYFKLGYSGKRITFKFYNSTADQDFFISHLLIDFKPLGLRP